MSIKKSFGGATIRKAGAYSVSQVSSDAGTPLESNDTILLIGEADAGEGGATDGIQSFSAAAFNQLKAKYRTGPLVDAAKAALSPSKTPGVNGAGLILIYKTNPSVQASFAMANTYGSLLSQEYGVGGNRITYKNALTAEIPAEVTGTAAVTNFAGLDTLTLILRQNGGADETVTFATPATSADLKTQIEAQTSDLTVSDAADVITIAMDAKANGHQDGYGRSLEVVGGTALGDLFLSAEFATPIQEWEATIEVSQPRDGTSELASLGGGIALSIARDSSGGATSASLTVTGTSMTLTDSIGAKTIQFSDAPLVRDLITAIGQESGWSAAAPSAYKLQPSSILDEVAAVGAFSDTGSPARLKADAQAAQDFFGASSLVSLDSPSETGLPDAEGPSNLAGGAKGASSSSSFDAGFAAALAQDLNIILPCVSQDASEDILAGETDALSTYDIETVHAQLDTHLRLRGSIKNRREAQGFCGYRKEAKADVFEQSGILNSALVQLSMQDVMVVDSSNELKWKQPHIHAALFAGIRLGTTVGEPLTHKYLNCAGIGHYVNTATGKVGGDYDPLIDYDEAIDAGVTQTEPAGGGFRVMLDNTTYGQDPSFVFNRGSVMEASQYTAKSVRSDAELAFVGRKNAVITAAGIKSRIRTKLIQLFNDQVLSPSDDAPQGYREDTFIVNVTGNTAEVQVEVKPVQGLDFVFITFTLGETTQSA